MFQKLLSRLARALDAGRIPYMVIGGQAVLLHGEPRLTRDIDVTLGVDVTVLQKVQSLVEGISLVPVVAGVEAFVRRTNVLPLADPLTGVRIDLIFSFTTYESEAIQRGVSVVIDDVAVRFASVEDLIIHKLVAGRPRDIEDVAGVLARKPALDEAYLTRWLDSFREIVHRDLVSEFAAMRRDQDASIDPA